MRILYIDPFSGISGDMMVGALLDLGADFSYLSERLSRLHVEGFQLGSEQVDRCGIRATQFQVRTDGEGFTHHSGQGHEGHATHLHRRFGDIRGMIESSELSPWVREKSVAAFRRLAEAEGKIHNRPADQVTFHEVGAVDSIVDIVGCMAALETLLPAKILSGPVNLGTGTLQCQHGIYPVPGPATENLLRGVPTFANEVSGELTTPTGAALLTTLAEQFCTRPLMRTVGTGYGAGARDTPGNANVLRVTLAETAEGLRHDAGHGEVAVIETDIDDMSPQLFGHVLERALVEGALDVYLSPIQMKKNRPGVKLTVVCGTGDVDRFARLVFAETTTIGIRYTFAQRTTLQRHLVLVDTAFGAIQVKVSELDGQRINFLPEFEDCRRVAEEKGVPLKDVQAAASHAFLVLASSR